MLNVPETSKYRPGQTIYLCVPADNSLKDPVRWKQYLARGSTHWVILMASRFGVGKRLTRQTWRIPIAL